MYLKIFLINDKISMNIAYLIFNNRLNYFTHFYFLYSKNNLHLYNLYI